MVEDVWDCYGTQSEPLPSVEDVWDCYGTRSEPLPGMEWWKTSETATALGRNHYQVWKTSGTVMALNQNHYPIWNGRRCLRLLPHSVGTTIKYKMVEDVRDCYGTWSEPLSNVWLEVETTTILDLEVLWGWDSLIANPPGHRLGMDQDDVWSLYMVKTEAGWFQGECLRPTTSTSPTKRNLITNRTRQMRRPDGRSKKNKK